MFGIFKAAKQRYQEAQTAQQELIVAFDAVGINFMHLDPIIHHVLLKEAMAVGTEKTMERFSLFAEEVANYEGTSTEEDKANLLREIYRARAAEVDAMER